MAMSPTVELLPFVFVITVKVLEGDHGNAEMEQMLFETQLLCGEGHIMSSCLVISSTGEPEPS